MKKQEVENFIRTRFSDERVYSVEEIVQPIDKWYEPRKPIGFEFPNAKRSKVDELFTQDKNISFEFFNQTIVFPRSLQLTADEIKESKFIYELSDNWDGMGAKKIDLNLYKDTIQFLIDYSLAAYNVHNIVIETPEINPCPNGSIDLSWRTPTVRLLINLKMEKQGSKVHYYRDHYNNEKSSKGELTLNTIDESFLVWMKMLK